MAPRSGPRPPRSKNALVIAASAITRSLESSKPSRLSTLRLLSDALQLFSNSKSAVPSSLPQKQQHDPGARALVDAAVAVLLTLPSTGGTLHRRALALLHAAGPAAGSATLLSATERARAHMQSLRPASITDGDLVTETAFAACAHTVAHTSRVDWAGRAAAEESIRVLLAVRGPRAVRSAAAHAVGRIFESFPINFAPDADLISTAAETVNSVCIKAANPSAKTTPKPGFALLAAAIAPRLAARPPLADKLLRACARALVDAEAHEKGIWAAAAARLAIIGRGARGKRPSRQTLTTGKKPVQSIVNAGPPAPEPQIFEGALVAVARIARLSRAGTGCVLALTAVLRAWAKAIPVKTAVIPARAVGLLATEATSISSASVLRDSIVVGVVRDLEPSVSYQALCRLQSLFGTLGRVGDAVVVDLCSVIVRRFGTQAVLESTADEDDGLVREGLLEMAQAALGTTFGPVRLAGVRLMAAVAAAVPERRVTILTSLLQGLRLAELALRGGDRDDDHGNDADIPSHVSARGASRPNSVSSRLSTVLGNAVALAIVLEEASSSGVGNTAFPIPQLLLKQCMVCAQKLLTPLPSVSKSVAYRDAVPNAVRRRAAWGIVAALARGRLLLQTVEGGLSCLFPHWISDLGSHASTPSDLRAGTKNGISDSGKGAHELSDVADELSSQTAKRCAALAALSACLAHTASPSLRKFAQFIVGGCASRVAISRNSPVHPAILASRSQNANMENDSTVDRVSRKYNESPSAVDDPDVENCVPTHSLLDLAEAFQVARCVALAPPIGALGELCYYVALALGEDAQRALGDAAGVPATGGVVAQFISSFSKSSVDQTAFVHRRMSLSALRPNFEALEKSGVQNSETDILEERANDYGWICSTEGLESPIAEEALVVSAEAVASLVVKSISLSASGSVVESFCSSSTFAPALSAALALAVARRISCADLAENGRVVAIMQVLVGRSLKASVVASALQNNPRPETRNLTSEGPWSGTCIDDADLPGSFFRAVASLEAVKPDQPLMFPVQYPLQSTVFHSPLTRALGVVCGTVSVTAEAYRVLAGKGGPAMWLGLMRSVTFSLAQSLSGKSQSHINLSVTCAAVLGALLEDIPANYLSSSPDQVSSAKSPAHNIVSQHKELKLAAKDAVNALAKAFDCGNYHTQAAAAVALSRNSFEIASESERLMAALSLSWSNDNGVDSSPAQLFKCAEDAVCWNVCLGKICNRVVKQEDENDGSSGPFLSDDGPGSACLSPALAVGVASVMCSSHGNMKEIAESSAVAGAELCTELLHWKGDSSFAAQTAGFRGLIEMWVARISSGRLQGAPNGTPISPSSMKIKRFSSRTSPASYIPINFFSLLQASQAGSPAGLYLEDVLYSALSSGIEGMKSGLQAVALKCVDLLLIESGREAVSTNFKRLPEILFGALLGGLLDCAPYLEILANADASKRPKYWIGLCRAVSLGGKRLNTETADAVWDVNLKARHVALRIMRIAVTCSIAKCDCECQSDLNDGVREREAEHTCALGCLREILSALLSTLRVSAVETSSVDEVCGTLKAISAVFQDPGRAEKAGPSAKASFEELWVPIAKSLAHLVEGKSSYQVVQITAETSCQWLLGCSAIQSVAIEEESVALARSLVGSEGLCWTSKRFDYLEGQFDVEVTDSVLSVLASVSQLVATRFIEFNLGSEHHPLDRELLRHAHVLKSLTRSACVDYTAMRSSDGNEVFGVSDYGGTFRGISQEELEKRFSGRMRWIFAAANVLAQFDENDDEGTVMWWKGGSPADQTASRMCYVGGNFGANVDAMCFANLVLSMNTVDSPEHEVFDPCGSFKRVAMGCAEVMTQRLNVEKVMTALETSSSAGNSHDMRSMNQSREGDVSCTVIPSHDSDTGDQDGDNGNGESTIGVNFANNEILVEAPPPGNECVEQKDGTKSCNINEPQQEKYGDENQDSSVSDAIGIAVGSAIENSR